EDVVFAESVIECGRGDDRSIRHPPKVTCHRGAGQWLGCSRGRTGGLVPQWCPAGRTAPPVVTMARRRSPVTTRKSPGGAPSFSAGVALLKRVSQVRFLPGARRVCAGQGPSLVSAARR